MDDYYNLRAWDALNTTAFEASLKGNLKWARRNLEDARQKSLMLSDPIPYLTIAENQLGENALALNDVDEAEKHFLGAHETLKRMGCGPSTNGREMVAAWQQMISLNRLGFLAHRRNELDEASNYYAQSVAVVKKLEQANCPPEELLPFRFEKMRAVLSSAEIALARNDFSLAHAVQRYFYR